MNSELRVTDCSKAAGLRSTTECRAASGAIEATTSGDGQRQCAWGVDHERCERSPDSLTAGIGVQSKANKERDFRHGEPWHFIVGGLLGTLLFVLAIWAFVRYLIAYG